MSALPRNRRTPRYTIDWARQCLTRVNSASVCIAEAKATMVTTIPIRTSGMRLAMEMKNALASAVNALSACAWRTASASLPKTFCGAIETGRLASVAAGSRAIADKLGKPLRDFVGPLRKGASLPRFEALDREGWLDLNLGILRRAVDPVLESGRMPNSLIVEVGRSRVNRYVGFMLAFLGRRVLGQYDPQLMSAEPIGGEGRYLAA